MATNPFNPNPPPKSDPTTGAGGTNSSTERGKTKTEPPKGNTNSSNADGSTTNAFGVRDNPNQSRGNGSSSGRGNGSSSRNRNSNSNSSVSTETSQSPSSTTPSPSDLRGITPAQYVQRQQAGYNFRREGDYYYQENSQTGQFQRIGMTPQEAGRRDRSSKGKATAEDVFYYAEKDKEGRVNLAKSKNVKTLIERSNESINNANRIEKERELQTASVSKPVNLFSGGSSVNFNNLSIKPTSEVNENGNELSPFGTSYGLRSYVPRSSLVSRTQKEENKTESFPQKSTLNFASNFGKNLGSFGAGFFYDSLVKPTVALGRFAVKSTKYLGGAIKYYGSNEDSLSSSRYESDFNKFSQAFSSRSISESPAKANVVLRNTFEGAQKAVQDNPSRALGRVVGDTVGFKVVGQTFALAKDVGVASVGKYVPVAEVVDEGVLRGAKFPYQKNPTKSLSEFKATLDPQTSRYSVVSAGPTKYPSRNTILEGAAGAANKEDAGLYATPKGRASAYFLEVGRTDGGYELSLNPFRPLYEEIRSAPTVTEFKVTNVKFYPKAQLESKGFEQSNKFLKLQAPTGGSFLTKRSTLGQTSEIEAVIPAGSKFKYVDNPTPIGRPYTFYKGRVVRLRTAETEGVIPTQRSSGQNSFERYFGKSSSSSRPSSVRSIAPNYSYLFRTSKGVSSSSSSRSSVSSISSYRPSSSVIRPSSSFKYPDSSSSYFRGSSIIGSSRGKSRSRSSSPTSYSASSSMSSILESKEILPRRQARKDFLESKKPKPSPSFKIIEHKKYTPTAYAIGFGIKGKKLKGRLSGLEFRGLV